VTIRYKNWRGAKLVKDSTKKFFFSDELKTSERWCRCVDVEGDYFEK
jgi:hypothetical protein